MQQSNRTFKLLLSNVSQLVTVCSNGERLLKGKQMDNISIIENASVVVDQMGKIAAVGKSHEINEEFKDCAFDNVIDCQGKSVIPGLVDGHTHPVWAGDRVHEFAMKLAGATYMDIHAMGGGIGFTVSHTMKATEDELYYSLQKRLNQALRHGTTLIEAKTGYGLTLEPEIKLLKVIHRAAKRNIIQNQENDQLPIPDIVTTYLAAHSVPRGSTSSEATEDIINNQIPVLEELISKGEISPQLIDVFLEKGVFDKEETRRILEAGKRIGLLANFHGDEINYMESGELAGEIGALSVSHLERVSKEGIAKMAEASTFAVLLPTTAYILRIHPPPARELIENGVPVALGSDFNPNAHCISMPFVMNLACVNMRMTMKEALAAATINAAGSLNRSDTHGSIEVGKWGDFVIIDASNWEHIIYQLGEPPIDAVVHHGQIIYCNKK